MLALGEAAMVVYVQLHHLNNILHLYLLHFIIMYSTAGSTITLSGKQFESSESNGNGTTVCPLQGYLFGSTVGWPETTPASAKKEHRPSLGELFQKTKLAEENYGAKYEKRTDKDSDKSAVHLMKKILKKKMLHASSRNSVASGGTADSVSSAETKPHKVGAFVLILVIDWIISLFFSLNEQR